MADRDSIERNGNDDRAVAGDGDRRIRGSDLAHDLFADPAPILAGVARLDESERRAYEKVPRVSWVDDELVGARKTPVRKSVRRPEPHPCRQGDGEPKADFFCDGRHPLPVEFCSLTVIAGATIEFYSILFITTLRWELQSMARVDLMVRPSASLRARAPD